jgi:hypothetical protein
MRSTTIDTPPTQVATLAIAVLFGPRSASIGAIIARGFASSTRGLLICSARLAT